MDAVLQTPRLLLRRFGAADVGTVQSWALDEEFTRFLPGFDAARSIERATAHWRDHGFGPLAVVERESGELVGRSGPAFHRMWPGDPEVGWWIRPGRWGRGYATEAGAASVEWALGELGFARVVSITLAGNAASRRVMAKLGFALLATVRDPELGAELLVHARARGAHRRAGYT